MKIEIGTAFPQYFKSAYPEEFDLFSHLETTSAIPSVLFAILAENSEIIAMFSTGMSFKRMLRPYMVSADVYKRQLLPSPRKR